MASKLSLHPTVKRRIISSISEGMENDVLANDTNRPENDEDMKRDMDELNKLDKKLTNIKGTATTQGEERILNRGLGKNATIFLKEWNT